MSAQNNNLPQLIPTGLINLDKDSISDLAKTVVQTVQEGNADALETLILAKKGQELFKAIEDNIKDSVYAKQYASKGETTIVKGCKVEQAELGVKYDYSWCGDPVYEDLLARFNLAKKLKEDREKFLKTVKGKMTIVTEWGEPVEIQEPIKSGQMGYKITIK